MVQNSYPKVQTWSDDGDVLDQVLEMVRIRSTVHGRLELTAPWGAEIDANSAPPGSPNPEYGWASFYVVARGGGWLETAHDGTAVHVTAGDLVLLPFGASHRFRDAPTSPSEPLEHILKKNPHDAHGVLRHGGGGAQTIMICGRFELEEPMFRALLETMPSHFHVRADHSDTSSWIRATTQLLSVESMQRHPGARTVIHRLADVLLVYAIRTLLETEDLPPGWLRGLKDPALAKALALMHQTPEVNWTLERLAQGAGLSRSGFARRFADTVGETPVRYLTRLRLSKAAQLLLRTTETVQQIAHQVGYDTEAAFNRAFKKEVGLPPGQYRRTAAAGCQSSVDRSQQELRREVPKHRG